MAVGGSQEPGQPLECDPVQRCLGAEYRNETVQDQGVDAVDGRCHVPHANAGCIPNYGERRRAGEAISTAFTESAVNQVISKRMVKKQQMRWTPRGAHLLLQIRTRVLNDQLAGDFHRWHPGFTHCPPDVEELAAAA